MKYIALVCIMMVLACKSVPSSYNSSAKSILAKCIKVHDPNNSWPKYKGSFDMNLMRDTLPPRLFTLHFDNGAGYWDYESKVPNNSFKMIAKAGKYSYVVGANQADTAGIVKRNLLSEVRSKNFFEVYDYLFGVPMRLARDAAYMAPQAVDTIFMQKPVWKITFNYGKEDEQWMFFINKSSNVLEGYQFFHEALDKDGEFIACKDYIMTNGVMQPKRKLWHWNNTGLHFRTDSVMVAR